MAKVSFNFLMNVENIAKLGNSYDRIVKVVLEEGAKPLYDTKIKP